MYNIYIFDEYASSQRNGIGTFIKEQIYIWKEMGAHINLMVFNSPAHEFLLKEEEQGIKTYWFPYFQTEAFTDFPKIIIPFLQLQTTDSPDNIFVVNHSPCLELLQCIKQEFPFSKILFIIHDTFWSNHLLGDIKKFRYIILHRRKKEIKSKYEIILQAYDKKREILNTADFIICLSNETKNLLIDIYKIYHQKISLIPNGMRDQRKKYSHSVCIQMRNKFHIPTHEKILLFVGRLTETKGGYALLKAFNLVLEHHPNTRLVIAGAVYSPDIVLNFSYKSAARITFLGHVQPKELIKWYSIADLGIIPSYSEQCSYTGIEMMMHQLPIVASDGNGMQDMFNDNENAIIAHIEDRKQTGKFVNNLSTAIQCLLSSPDLCYKIRKNARKKYVQCYNIQNMKQGYNDLIELMQSHKLKFPKTEKPSVG